MMQKGALFICLLGLFPLGFGQNSNLTWNYIEQLGTGAMWSAVSSDSTGQYLVSSQMYNQDLVMISSNFGNDWYPADFQPYVAGGFVDFASSESGQYVTGVSVQGLWVSNEWGEYLTYNFNVSTEGSSAVYFSAVDMSNDGAYQYASVYNGDLWKSVDFGQNWAIMTVTYAQTILTGMYWSSIATSGDGSHIYVTASYAKTYGVPMVLYSYDFGATWGAAYTNVNNWQAIVCSQSGQYVATSNQNYPSGSKSVFVSTNYGRNYTATLSYPNSGSYLYFYDLAMDYSGQNIAIATQGVGVVVSANYGANGTWDLNSSVPVSGQYGTTRYQTITVDSTGRYFVVMATYAPCYTTHNYTWDAPTDDSPDMAEAIGFGLMGFGLGLIACMVVGIYVKEFVMTGRSITTLFDKPKPQHLTRRADTQSKEPARMSEPLIADNRENDII